MKELPNSLGANNTMKTFLIDTNVLLHDPDALLKFGNNRVVIPVSVLEELDKMKRAPAELGKNARTVILFLSGLKARFGGDLHTGVQLKDGPNIRIQLEEGDASPSRYPLIGGQILATALALQKKGEKVVFVSKDLAARIKAEALNIKAEDYENLKFNYEFLPRGIYHINVPKGQIDEFYQKGEILLNEVKPLPNEYCVLTAEPNSSAIGRYDSAKKSLTPLVKYNSIWGVKPRNVEQRCAMDLLLRDDVRLVCLIGPAGTGKTLLALAAALHLTFDQNRYRQILVSRPIMPLGRDIGYLPGSKEEKLFHWMQPIYDNLRYLCEGSDGEDEKGKETMKWIMDSNKIEMEAVTYIRGRTLPHRFIIIDEAQNLTPHEVKTIISRAGSDTKVILTGDPTQIDNPYLDKDSNALTYAIGSFSDHKIFGHIFMEKTERSELAALVAERM